MTLAPENSTFPSLPVLSHCVGLSLGARVTSVLVMDEISSNVKREIKSHSPTRQLCRHGAQGSDPLCLFLLLRFSQAAPF